MSAEATEADLERPRITRDELVRVMKSGPNPPKLPHGPDESAVFDPFEFEGREYFFFYDGSVECWQLGRPIPPKGRVTDIPDPEASGDNPAHIEALNALNFMPPPRLPQEFEEPTFRAPFWHRENQWCWVLVSIEEGWNLAFCEPKAAGATGQGDPA